MVYDRQYDDIINLPHFEPKHKRMTISERSAQFAPFAALTGYSEEIIETSRYTDEESIILDDYNDIFDNVLSKIEKNIKNRPEVSIMYFVPDKTKSGGKYVEYKDRIKKIDHINKKLVFKNNREISFESIKYIDYCDEGYNLKQ